MEPQLIRGETMMWLTIPMASVLMLAVGGRLPGQIVVNQDTTVNYTTEEDVHIVNGANPVRSKYWAAPQAALWA